MVPLYIEVGTRKRAFKPDLIEPLGQGGFAKVFKAKFHGKICAMKYIPLDKVKDSYTFDVGSYGLHEYVSQEKFRKLLYTTSCASELFKSWELVEILALTNR